MMSRFSSLKFPAVFLSLVTLAALTLFNPWNAVACGWGSSGGSDYVPQRQGRSLPNTIYPNQTESTIDAASAKDIVDSHLSKLNPDLAVGTINDSGGFFEVEVLNKSREVVQLLGVDKYSGQLMLLN